MRKSGTGDLTEPGLSRRPAAAGIGAWRRFLQRRRGRGEDLAAAERDLRNEIDALAGMGLSAGEAFVVAIRRIARRDPETRRFAASRGFLKGAMGLEAPAPAEASASRIEVFAGFGLALGAALTMKAPELFGWRIAVETDFYLRNLGLFVLPWAAVYLGWRRGVDRRTALVAGAGFLVAGLFANVYPFAPGGSTGVLTTAHVVIVLWAAVGFVFVGGRWKSHRERMRLVHFSGELFIHFVLLWLGGMVLAGLGFFLFGAIGIEVGESFIEQWLVPCVAAAGVVLAVCLVHRRRALTTELAPMLARVFIPFFAMTLLAFLATMAWTGRGIAAGREVLIGLDALLALVVGLVLYSVAARDGEARPGTWDCVSLVLVLAALAVDLVALTAMVGRISEFGWTPNRSAALGENLILLVNLAGSAWLLLAFVRGKGSFPALARWQTGFLPVYAAWAAFVLVAFPPLFGFG